MLIAQDIIEQRVISRWQKRDIFCDNEDGIKPTKWPRTLGISHALLIAQDVSFGIYVITRKMYRYSAILVMECVK